jgi:hypothetical protein
MSAAEYEAELKTIQRNRALMQDVANNAQEQLAVFQSSEVIYSDAYPDLGTSTYDNEIETFESRTRTMGEIARSLTDPLLG